MELKLANGEVHTHVTLPTGERGVCPECHSPAPIHDHQERTWRHLDTCQYKTLIRVWVPRLDYPTHGIRQLAVPWSEPDSKFMALCAALAIGWLKLASVKAVATQLRGSWEEADGIMGRAVLRGQEQRKLEAPRYAGVDETSLQSVMST